MYDLRNSVWMTPGGHPVTFHYRADTNDWNTLSACLAPNDEYHIKGLSLEGDVLDIGGYLGSVGISVAVDNPKARVLIVEPVPWNADLIEQNARQNGVEGRVTVFRGAAGPRGVTKSEIRFGYRGTETLEHHAFVGNSSLAYDDGGEAQHEALTVETLGLVALLDRFDLTPVWTKIDCEGGEWSFLDVPAKDLRRLPHIVGEAHSVRGHKGKDIEDVLGATHVVTLIGDGEGTCEFAAVLR